MNFGVAGVFLIMIVLGGVLATLQHVFAGPSSGPGGQAIFVAMFVYFLNGIGSSAEIMFGGLIQNLLCASLLLLLVSRRTSERATNLNCFERTIRVGSKVSVHCKQLPLSGCPRLGRLRSQPRLRSER